MTEPVRRSIGDTVAPVWWVAELLRITSVTPSSSGSRTLDKSQVRAIYGSSSSRLTKVLRAQVKTTLQEELPKVDDLPLTLLVGDRVFRSLVRETPGHLVAQDDAPPLDTRALAGRRSDRYFAVREENV